MSEISTGGLNAGFLEALESLPPALSQNIPAGSPPPGVIPNFEHPSTLFPALLSVLIVFGFFTMASFTIRVYMKAVFLKNWRWDDTMITLGLFATLFCISAGLCGITYGALGFHIWEIHLDRAISKAELYAGYVFAVSTMPSYGFVKMTFLIQFYYLFKPLRWLRLSCWIGGGLIAFVYASTSIIAFVLSSPWPGEDFVLDLFSWHFTQYGQNLSIPIGVFGLVTDMFLLILPIPAVMGLQLALKKKIGVLIVFALGMFAIVGSALNLYYRVLVAQSAGAGTAQADPGWWTGYLLICSIVELLTGITAANMPVMHQFFVRKNIMQRLHGSKISTTIRDLLSNVKHMKSSKGDDTSVRTDSFDSRRIVTNAVSHTGLEKINGIDWKHGTLIEAQIVVSQDYTVESYSRQKYV